MLLAMILQTKPSSRHHGILTGVTATAPLLPVPAWLRRAVPDAQSLVEKQVEDVALTAGAAIGALDTVVRRQERWAGAWRQRLALAAAAATAKQGGRIEDENALRDAVLLARPGDDVGPGGRLLLAWRRLAARLADELLTEKSLAAVLDEFGYALDDKAVTDLAADLRQLGASGGIAGMLTRTFKIAERHGFGRAFGCWLADVLLAQRLGWTHAVPLLGTNVVLSMSSGRSRRSATAAPAAGAETEADRAKNLLVVQACAALRAIDLFTDLERRAEKLLTVAPKLRAKGSDAIVDRLLNEDALIASRQDNGVKGDKKMSDRGLRRLFDRLQKLGAVRELSGRPTFRIYGL